MLCCFTLVLYFPSCLSRLPCLQVEGCAVMCEVAIWRNMSELVPEYPPLSTPTSSFSKCGELCWWDGEERINWPAQMPSVTKETNQGNCEENKAPVQREERNRE